MGYFTMKNRKVTSFDEYVCSSPNTVLHQLKSIRKYLLISIQCSSGGKGSQDTMPRLNRATGSPEPCPKATPASSAIPGVSVCRRPLRHQVPPALVSNRMFAHIASLLLPMIV